MALKQRVVGIVALLAGATLFVAPSTSFAGTSAPFYFVDQNGNEQALYTDEACNGVMGSCVGFGHYCGTGFYSSSYTLEQGRKDWDYRGYIGIRQNSGNYGVVCKLEK
ncbi:hypothetical protein [Maritalea sp.]|uniref:hypothetical protein n=1 Tax=Maritalea sp. TaxID=2003361 RepID=UPI003EF2481B